MTFTEKPGKADRQNKMKKFKKEKEEIVDCISSQKKKKVSLIASGVLSLCHYDLKRVSRGTERVLPSLDFTVL